MQREIEKDIILDMGERKGVNWGLANTSEMGRRLGRKRAWVARFLEMTTASVNRMARQEEMAELDERDK